MIPKENNEKESHLEYTQEKQSILYDVESHREITPVTIVDSVIQEEQEQEQEQTPGNRFHSGIVDKLTYLSKRLDNIGVESTGIDRIPPYERGSSKLFLHVAGLWLSATGGLSSMSSFLLGPLLFELNFNQSLVSGLIGMAIGCVIAAYCSTMGPQSGCRQMVTARYLFGWWSVKLIALAAIIGVLGWSVVNSVVGGEMLAAISNDKVPVWVGILIVTLCSFFVAVFGIKQVLKVETYLAVPVLTTFLLLYISSSDKYDLIHAIDNSTVPKDTIKGNWLSFFSLCYSITSTWGSITADYYILFPEDTAQYKVFLLTLFGTLVPTLFVGVLGVLLAAVAVTYQPWNDEYTAHGMGGLLWSGFARWNGFGKFCVVILILSLVSNNIINTYSAAFSIQLSSVYCSKIPRWFWCIVCTIIYLVCALVGRNHFSTILGNFLPMIGYWISMYFILLFEENVIFRRYFLHMYTKEFPKTQDDDDNDTIGTRRRATNLHLLKRKHIAAHHRYNWDEWQNYDVLTHGYAATFAFLCGVAGVVVGMAQVYWIGPIARRFGEFGGDIAMWLSMGFSGVVYPWVRYLELKKFGR
ncbi:similar to Saccharomyces cerevisiae YGL186C TPN1 Plasma membrane pyridoxine (vitamin B6) transporter [Maudiozyma barnettii]|uniref:Vitamin B6 transporter TPN1 n=1 Tax=Maudiozyma barnettii TaxID=61262 RepID=A0A8H2VBX6_9SACH|nr:Tpn1p [Kazachstania barnettii]CAB4252423.1 similar to Saccharomyces cerevisiae YGL186C TPN1 Plasma membrane pyridoxine (vitamin B6) transporter [Kazachstania barnettii]CAD1779158.1 similar to Saccharomyces cerevisiae YGL186C TPN1 Plasma membrane pyridoxine (vitamin B6) transporter [Kazachstania barnettii]